MHIDVNISSLREWVHMAVEENNKERERASKDLTFVPQACISLSGPASRQIFLGDDIREKVRRSKCKVNVRKVSQKRREKGQEERKNEVIIM